MRHREFGRHWVQPSGQSLDVVDGVSGCVMLIRREVLEEAGLLDERYFFSFEDLEFCLRATRAGFLSAVDSGAVAYHAGGASIRGRSARRIYFATRNHLLLANETPCPGGVIAHRVRDLSIAALNIAFAITNGEIPLLSGLSAVVQGVWDHARGRYGDPSI
jgi:GT2 family glycosyltransferase